MINYATFFYENGFSCLDIINWLEHTDIIDGLKKYEILLYFNKIKSEYRCEKLLMLCILLLILTTKLYLMLRFNL
jgi:hypothetical protein